MLTFTASPVTKIDAMTFADYQSAPGINQSLLRLYDRASGGAPAKYRHAVLHPEDRPAPSSAMEFGSAYHCLSLTPEEFDSRYVIRTAEIEEMIVANAQTGNVSTGKKRPTRTKFHPNLTAYKDWCAEQSASGRVVISEREANQLHAMRAALLESAELADCGIFDKGCAFEVSLFAGYTLPGNSGKPGEALRFQLKGRVDAMPVGNAIIDLKSARSAHPRQFARTVADMRMDIQSAFYLDLASANGIPKKRFAFLAQDKEPPYLPALLWMPEDWIRYGRSTATGYKRILNDIAESIRKDYWPGYGEEMLEWPGWLTGEIEAVAA